MMGGCFQKERRMADQYKQMSGSKSGIVVQFYGAHIFPNAKQTLALPQEAFPLSCEEVCIQAVKYLSSSLEDFFTQGDQKILGPKFLPLFGLYAADHDLQQWVPDAHVFDDATSNEKFYLRVKVRPASDKIPEGVFAEYLFWQCVEDFLTGRVWSHFGTDIKIRDVHSVNKVAMWVLMGRAPFGKASPRRDVLHAKLKEVITLDAICDKVTLMSVSGLIPKRMTPELEKDYNIGDLWMKFFARRFLRKSIKTFYGKWEEENLSLIHYNFVKTFMDSFVPYYLLEYFPAEKIGNYRKQEDRDRGELPPTPIEMVIRPHQDGCVPGLYFGKKYKAHLKDIFGADIQESESKQAENKKCRILLKIQHSQPLILDMSNQKQAKSFLCVLETYCRLKFNYCESLNFEHLAAPSLQVLDSLHSFGPMEEDRARQYLREQKQKEKSLAQCEAFHMIYQDTEEFNLLHVAALRAGADPRMDPEIVTHDIRYTVNNTEPTFTFTVRDGEEDRIFSDRLDRGYDLTTTKELGHRIIPREDDMFGAKAFLQDSRDPENYYSYAGAGSERTAKKRSSEVCHQPVIYRSDDQLNMKEAVRIAQGEFSDVYRIRQMEQGRAAVVKKVTSRQHEVQDKYREGTELLLKLREHSSTFVRVIGSKLSSPSLMVLECMPDGNGSLLQRLRKKDALPLNWLQVASVLRQLADCLCSLKEAGIMYGNFCCAKILIWKETDMALTIRLGDPSLALYYNTLRLDDPHNDRRLPWLAPERFAKGKIVKCTIESEIYAVGTTIWEMLWQGKDPMICVPHTGKTRDFFAKGNKLPDPKFTQGGVTQGDISTLNAGGEGDGSMERTQRWVRDQDFSSEEDSPPAEVDDYSKVGKQDSEQGSRLASGETEETNLSGGSAAGPQEGGAPQNPTGNAASGNKSLAKIQRKVLDLMHACWHQDPKQRPTPLAFLKACCEVEDLADKAMMGCELWNIHLLVKTAIEMGDVRDRAQAEQLEKAARQAQMNTLQERQKLLQDYQNQVQNVVRSVIDHTLVIPTGRSLGQGQFGEVIEAILIEPSETREEAQAARKRMGEKVAVKKMKANQSQSQTVMLLKETLAVYNLKHSNVVELKGIVMQGRDNPYQLVMEFADQGSLEEHLKNIRNQLGVKDTKKELQRFAEDIAKGMKYICEGMKLVHGDLAARNVLLFSSDKRGGKPWTAKIADFGLAHKLNKGQRGNYYYDIKKTKAGPDSLPVFWMPCEIVENWNEDELKYSIKTDVWSFGVTMWEMFSARSPDKELNARGLADKELIADLTKNYREGKRLPKPQYCPKKVYAIMLSCWNQDDTSRPNFTTLIQRISDLTENELDLD